ncbi:sulfide:quinone oxidoreductase, mitochondrial isoform X2 [Parasteatoda tepidariorum]|nr:sulfide:quinone oxidoreductase, mitochondrial isoform X2 [Parasteatoda tepidariorum]XP_042909698.1 sulfide:quinone oxidoreductase, mitochondrial isoform X2 [Parasteatoda tepidariorum]
MSVQKSSSKLLQFKMLSFSATVSRRKSTVKILIVGGGTGGISMAAKLLRLGESDVTVIEPADVHYYQPYWTLVGAMKKRLDQSYRSMSSVMPKGATWIRDRVIKFDPTSNRVFTSKAGEIEYSCLLVALGMQLSFDKIKGLPGAFETEGVCSIYSPPTVLKTCQALERFAEGNAIFTQPLTPIKCGGAPQKIMYLAEEYFAKVQKRDKANVIFNTAHGNIFGCPKYNTVLQQVAKNKNITVNYLRSLSEVRPDTKEAVFQKLDVSGHVTDTETFKYEMLHVVPPMAAPDVIRESDLSDSISGYMDVDKHTLQSKRFKNVFGLGDCTNLPTSKTAAAVAGQCGVLIKNMKCFLKGEDLTCKYSGYTSCPLVTGYNKGVMAEFNYELQPEETLPIDQGKERYIFYFIKKEVLPIIYWNFMLKGLWSGPSTLRKILHLGLT